MSTSLLSTTLTLLSTLTLAQHTIYSNHPDGTPRTPNGPHGQECEGVHGGAKCSVGEFLAVQGGEVACQHNFDCCPCGQVKCTDGCVGLVCNGDSARFGIKDVILEGDTEMGVGIICNGDVSCQGTYIEGKNVGEIYCTGDDSCAYSKFNIHCLISHGMGCEVNCGGENSCEGDPLDARKVAIYNVENSHGMVCAVEGCRWGQFILTTDTGGTVDCGGNNGCEHSDILIHNAEAISCGGIQSCRHAHIVVVNPVADHFSITCSGLHACHGLDIEVIIDDPSITHMDGITCIAANGCERMKIAVVKQGAAASSAFTIGALDCGMAGACNDMRVDLGQAVTLEECHCVPGGCDGLLGVQCTAP